MKAKSFIIENSELMREWDWEKNNALGLFPDKLSSGTTKKVWWKCNDCQNEWIASIGHRTDKKRPTKCPKCSANERWKKRHSTLFQETSIARIFPQLLEEWDVDKNTVLPTEITKGSHERIWWKCKNGHEWQTSVGNRIKGHGCPYCSGRFAITGVNDLKTINSELAAEWNYEKNGELKPEKVTYGSTKKVWWKCKNGHEWQATICNRNKKEAAQFVAWANIYLDQKRQFVFILKNFFSLKKIN